MLKNILSDIIEKITGDKHRVSTFVEEIRAHNPHLENRRLAAKVANKIKRKCAMQGGLFALPGSVPGIGSLLQLGIASFDFSNLIRNQVYMIHAIGYCFEIKNPQVLKNGTIACLGKGLNIFDKNDIKNQIGKKLGSKISDQLAKFIVKQLSKKLTKKFIFNAMIKLIPFGLGMILGFMSHWKTMSIIQKNTIQYFEEMIIQEEGENHQ